MLWFLALVCAFAVCVGWKAHLEQTMFVLFRGAMEHGHVYLLAWGLAGCEGRQLLSFGQGMFHYYVGLAFLLWSLVYRHVLLEMSVASQVCH